MYYTSVQRGKLKEDQKGLQEAFHLGQEADVGNASSRGLQKPERDPLTLPGALWNSFSKKETAADWREQEEMTSPQRSRLPISKQSVSPPALPANAHYIRMMKSVRDPNFLAQFFITGWAREAKK